MATLDTRSTAQRRMERKVGHIETARQCGSRCARLHVGENDPKAFLDNVDPGGLTSREQRA